MLHRENEPLSAKITGRLPFTWGLFTRHRQSAVFIGQRRAGSVIPIHAVQFETGDRAWAMNISALPFSFCEKNKKMRRGIWVAGFPC
jgi:hypothetical protein